MDWREEEHPRDKDGKFTSGGGGSTLSAPTMTRSKKLYDKSTYIMLPKKEYAELCSAIRTEHANKIPKLGYMLYKDDLYAYTYSRVKEQILCIGKIPIHGNEEKINDILRRGYEFDDKRR